MAPLASSTRELFGEAVGVILESWPVLQIAVDNGFGGAFSLQKAEWMVGALQQYFIDNEDLQQVEVEDFLSELMNNEFDTVVDDCSLPQVAQQVCSLFQLCEQGRLLEVRGQINALREKKSSAGRAKATAAQSHDQDEEADEDCSEEQQEAMECEVASQGASVSEQLPHHKEEDEEEDGWTTVVRRKK